MTNLAPDPELENELQEVYMQATHWLQDISFLETETHFFRNIINRYDASAAVHDSSSTITEQRKHVAVSPTFPPFHASTLQA